MSKVENAIANDPAAFKRNVPGFQVAMEGGDGLMYVGKVGTVALKVITSVAREDDGKRWLHLSLSLAKGTGLPGWYELRTVKELFIGKDALAIQVLPADSEYVNLNQKVLHLWSCLDGRPLPDFSGIIPGVGRSI